MKTLQTLLNHFFPRKRWTIIKKVVEYDTDISTTMPCAYFLIMQDQFGNIKKIKY